jgi:hypothetical protein
MVRDLIQITLTPPGSATQSLELRATACHSRGQTMNQIYALLDRCNGFLLQDTNRADSGQSWLEMEVPRRNIFDLYSGLLSIELDLTRDSHLHLTGLCTLRLYRPMRTGNVTLKLELTFPDEIDLTEPWAAIGFA